MIIEPVMDYNIMCKVNEQVQRTKKPVDPTPRRPIIKPNTSGKGIIQEGQ